MKYHVNNSPAAKGFTPVNPADKRPGFGAARESFGMGNDYTNPEQHAIKVAPPDAVPLNQWPDNELPEFRQNVYSYCRGLHGRLPQVLTNAASHGGVCVCQKIGSDIRSGTRS